MSRSRIIIDTDPGVDDAMAIFYAMLHPNIDLVGMTGVFGNVTSEIAARNALVLAEYFGVEVPVAKGADRPLVQKPNPVSDYVHGEEGFGNVPAQKIIGKPIDLPAHEYICKIINENPGEIDLCPIGPLTNIALALESDPSITKKVKSVVLMGGALRESGNVSDFSEANIWNDPHAADIVFAADWPITMVGLDVTHKVMLDKNDFAELAKKSPKLGGFLQEAADFYIDFYKEKVGIDGCYMHDPMAVMAILYPELFEVENLPIEVKIAGGEIGQTFVSDSSRPNTKVCVSVQSNKIKKLFMSTISSGF